MQMNAGASFQLVVEINIGIMGACATCSEQAEPVVAVEDILASAAMIRAIAVADGAEVDVVGGIGEYRHARGVPEIMRRRLTGRLAVAHVVGIIPAQHRAIPLGIGAPD